MSFKTLDTNPETIFIEINDKNTALSEGLEEHLGALLTSGAFTMMVALVAFKLIVNILYMLYLIF